MSIPQQNSTPKLRKTHKKIIALDTKRTSFMDNSGNWTGDNVFEKVSPIGSGGFGEVWKVRHTAMRFTAAAKIIKVSKTPADAIEDEIQTFKKMKHPNILTFLGSYRNKDSVWILMDLCNAGSLKDIMRVLNVPFSEETVACIVKGVVSGLDALHNASMIHLDVKPANILISNDCVVKLTDFGISKHSQDTREDKWYGSAPYMAPEIKSDVWSLGITILELREKKPPYEDLSAMRILELIKKHQPPTFKNKEENSENIINFVAMCLVKDAKQRASIAQLKKHKFIENATDSQSLLNLCVSAHQAKYHFMPRIEVLPEGRFCIKYNEEEDFNRNQIKTNQVFYSPLRQQQNQSDAANTHPENTPQNTPDNFVFENVEVFNEHMRDSEKFKADIETLNERVLALEENAELYGNQVTNSRLNELKKMKDLFKSWAKESFEDIISTLLDEKLCMMMNKDDSDDASRGNTPKNEVTECRPIPRLSPKKRIKRETNRRRDDDSLSPNGSGEHILGTSRRERTKKSVSFTDKNRVVEPLDVSSVLRRRRRNVKSYFQRNEDIEIKTLQKEIAFNHAHHNSTLSLHNALNHSNETTMTKVSRSPHSEFRMAREPKLNLSTEQPSLFKPDHVLQLSSSGNKNTSTSDSGRDSPVVSTRSQLAPTPTQSHIKKDTQRKLLNKQKRFQFRPRNQGNHSPHSSTHSVDVDIEAKIFSLLRFEIAKAKALICEMVPSNYEILRTELIEEIERRSQIYKFGDMINEDLPSNVYSLQSKIEGIERKIVDLDIALSRFHTEVPEFISLFKNQVLEEFRTL
ncbi:non-specific serine/threonine protein kinase [Entamoeba marina]